MADLIDRQAAIDALKPLPTIDGLGLQPLVTVDDAIKVLNNLPSVQPVGKDINVSCKDAISRQDAIDALANYIHNIDKVCGMGKLLSPDDCNDAAKSVLDDLPSVQPEIIRCKDCKHWIPYDWMFSEVWRSKNIADYPEDEIGCNYCDMAMKANDFCSRGERRTE